MPYTKQQALDIYHNELSIISSLRKEEADKVIAKYTKDQLIAMAKALYGSSSMDLLRKQRKVAVIRNIRMLIEGVERALRMKP